MDKECQIPARCPVTLVMFWVKELKEMNVLKYQGVVLVARLAALCMTLCGNEVSPLLLWMKVEADTYPVIME